MPQSVHSGQVTPVLSTGAQVETSRSLEVDRGGVYSIASQKGGTGKAPPVYRWPPA